MRYLIAIIAAIALPGLAMAADKGGPGSTVADYMPAPARSWTGPYIGAHIGAASMDNSISFGPASFDGIGGQGLAYGATGGYDLQMGKIVVGMYGDYTRHEAESSLALGGVGASVGPTDQWAVGGRAGVLLTDTTLVYALGGYTEVSYSSLSGTALKTAIPMPSFTGYQLGGGIETTLPMLPKGWTLDARYTWSHLGSEAVAASPVLVQPDIHMARVGLTYRMGGF